MEDEGVEECLPEEAEFWGVYRRELDKDGDKLAYWLADFDSLYTANHMAAHLRIHSTCTVGRT